MKICPECHKLSKFDDFCSHCGSAVYGSDDFSQGTISCDDIKGHSHEKTTYSTGPIVNGPAYNGRDFTQMRDNVPQTKKNSGVGCFVVIIIAIAVFSILGDMDTEEIEELFSGLAELIHSLMEM